MKKLLSITLVLLMLVAVVVPTNVFAKNNNIKKISGLKASKVTSSSIKVTWNKQKGCKYEVLCQKKKGAVVVRSTISTTSFNIYKLSAGTNYNIKVRGKKGKSSGSWAPIEVLTCPGKVSKWIVKRITMDGMQFEWKKVKTATKYEIKVKKNGKLIQHANVENTSYFVSFDNLKAKDNYSFSIRAKNKSGGGSWVTSNNNSGELLMYMIGREWLNYNTQWLTFGIPLSKLINLP